MQLTSEIRNKALDTLSSARGFALLGLAMGTIGQSVDAAAQSTWVVEDQRLELLGGAQQARFGRGLAVSGNWAAVGAPHADFGGQITVGEVHIYERLVSGWVFRQIYRPNDYEASDQIGMYLEMDGSTLVVGAPSNGGGAVYVLEQSGGVWSQTQN